MECILSSYLTQLRCLHHTEFPTFLPHKLPNSIHSCWHFYNETISSSVVTSSSTSFSLRNISSEISTKVIDLSVSRRLSALRKLNSTISLLSRIISSAGGAFHMLSSSTWTGSVWFSFSTWRLRSSSWSWSRRPAPKRPGWRVELFVVLFTNPRYCATFITMSFPRGDVIARFDCTFIFAQTF